MKPVTSVHFEPKDSDGFRKWQGNPALFFLGAPSEFAPTMQGQILRRLRAEAKLTQNYRGVRHHRLGVYAVKRQERAILPDGTIYEMSSTWVEEPAATVRKSTHTQTTTSSRLPKSLTK